MWRSKIPYMVVASFAICSFAFAQTDAEKELQRIKAEYAPVFALTGTAKDEILAIARVLAQKPSMAIDFSQTTGQYCMHFGNLNMVHYATDPAATSEDAIYILNAKPFIENGLQVEKMPRVPTEPGKMEPGKWYFQPEKVLEPHHHKTFEAPLLMMAIDVK